MGKIEQIEQLLAGSPNDSFLQHALALEYIKFGNEEKAVSLFENVLLIDPTYVGSYYHLAKLYERAGDYASAIEWYNKGMLQAKAAKDNHSYNELQGALEDLEDL